MLTRRSAWLTCL